MLSVVSWGIMAMASSVDKELMFIQLLVARFIIGICIGLSSSPSAVYSAEIAHPTLRGRISVITSVTIGLGILLIYVMGYFIPVSFNEKLFFKFWLYLVLSILYIPLHPFTSPFFAFTLFRDILFPHFHSPPLSLYPIHFPSWKFQLNRWNLFLKIYTNFISIEFKIQLDFHICIKSISKWFSYTYVLYINNENVIHFQTNWRLVSGISCAICVVALILLIPIPETPTWLASKGRTAKAEKSLRIFKGLPRKGKKKKVFHLNI